MKVMVSIFSFIVVILSTLPCYAYHIEAKHQIEKQCDDHSRKCGDECNGNCSPFYACGTCTGFIFNFSTSFLMIKTIASTNTSVQPISYDSPVHSNFFCKIWQPPKKA